MKLVTLLGLAGALAIVVTGCGDDGGRGTTDSGIVLMDSGTGPADSGSGGDTSTPPPMDGGGGTCPPEVVPAPTTPACAASTQTCAMGATDQAMLEACIIADPDPMGCNTCVSQAQVSCLTMNGCDDTWGEIGCCGMAAACSDFACIETNCAGELSAFNTCATGVGVTCDIVSVAFAACTIPAG